MILSLRHQVGHPLVEKSATRPGRRVLRFNSNAVVDGSADPLYTAKISLSRPDRNVSEKELDLFQFSAGGVTQLRTGAAKVMGSEPREAKLFGMVFDHVPDYPFRYTITPAFASATDAAKQPSG